MMQIDPQELVVFVGNAAIKTTMVFGVIFAALSVCRKASASVRHYLLELAFLCALVLPVASLVVSNIPVVSVVVSKMPVVTINGMAQPVGEVRLVQTTTGNLQTSPATGSSISPQDIVTAVAPHNHRSYIPRLLVWDIIAVVWFGGFVFKALQICISLYDAKKLTQFSKVIDHALLPRVQGMDTSGPLPVEVRVVEAVMAGLPPMTLGWKRPVILLPTHYTEWPTEKLFAVLVHEMAHIRRGDWASHIIAQVVCAFYWFNPLMTIALAKMHETCEAACDDYVLERGVSATQYAQHLLDIAVATRDFRRMRMAAVTMAGTNKITERLAAILAEGKSRRVISSAMVQGGLWAALVIGCLTGALKVIAMPHTAAAYIKLGIGSLSKHHSQLRYGIPDFRRAIALEPNNALAHMWLSRALAQTNYIWHDDRRFTQGGYIAGGPPSSAALAEAIRELQTAVALDGNHADWWWWLGQYKYEEKQYGAALADCRKSMSLMPPLRNGDTVYSVPSANGITWEDCYESLGRNLIGLGRTQEGVAALRMALATAPWDGRLALRLASALDHAGRSAEATTTRQLAYDLLRNEGYSENDARRQVEAS